MGGRRSKAAEKMNRLFSLLTVVVILGGFAATEVTAQSVEGGDAAVEFTVSPPADFDPHWYQVRLRGITDADTITCDIVLGLGVVIEQQKLRLWGIDAWEIRGEERPRGLAARDFVAALLIENDSPRPILLRTRDDRRGKYGRWLAEIFVKVDEGWINLSVELVENGHAEVVEY